MCGLDGLEKHFLAHSARPEQGIPAQDYAVHARNVEEACCRNVRAMFPEKLLDSAKVTNEQDYFARAAMAAAPFHDLGKLAQQNQAVLSGQRKGRSLPINHCDAGALQMLNLQSNFAAMLIYSHHIGLPEMSEIRTLRLGKAQCFRDNSEDGITAKDSERNLGKYLDLHRQLMDIDRDSAVDISVPCELKKTELRRYTAARLMLSCLVDADHSDTAVNYGNLEEKPMPLLSASERLAALDKYVESLAAASNGPLSERNKKRGEMYLHARNSECDSPLCYCDSPVGTGKTTAITAYMLNIAARKGLRRLFIILPFINILNQTVDILRKALRLPGESEADMKNVVAAIHHRAEYKSENDRCLSSLWRAPIIVTTAVQFFETMAGAKPERLRKLHELPGSAVFIDEAHAALPIELWPTAWLWLKEYAASWRCHFVLASGTSTKFWTLDEVDDLAPEARPVVEPLLSDEFRCSLNNLEIARVHFKRLAKKMNESELCDFILSLDGPRIVILNTVQSAAVVAQTLLNRCGADSVVHLSTALSPKDRKAVLDRVREKLKNKSDNDWTLVATSCVEAGVDFSFRTGVREAAGLVNLLQMAGRVRRNEEKGYEDSVVWTVELTTGEMLKLHPAFKYSSQVLLELFERDENLISKGQNISDLCRKALKAELGKNGCMPGENDQQALIACERSGSFKTVQERFNVIDTQSVTLVIDESLKTRIEAHEKVSWQEIQDGSVQIYGYSAQKLGAMPINGSSELYFWPFKYDNFIGYMAGVLENEKMSKDGFAFS